jgi:hypothetical protein
LVTETRDFRFFFFCLRNFLSVALLSAALQQREREIEVAGSRVFFESGKFFLSVLRFPSASLFLSFPLSSTFSVLD